MKFSMSGWSENRYIKLFLIAPRSAKAMALTGLAIDLILIFFIIFGQMVAPYDAIDLAFKPLQPPSGEHIMGTDSLGRDLFSRMIVGSRYSLGIALISTGVSLIIGLTLGSISGYFAGPLDRVLMLIMDSLYAFPSFILVLIMSVLLGPGIPQTALAISISRIPSNYRIIRSVTLIAKERGFIEAEKVIGASTWYIIQHHILPFYLSLLFVIVALGMASGTLAVSGLGFLGLGIPPPAPEWGTELALGRPFLLMGAWWLVVFPGLFILLAVLGFNLLSDGLEVIINPAIRRLK